MHTARSVIWLALRAAVIGGFVVFLWAPFAAAEPAADSRYADRPLRDVIDALGRAGDLDIVYSSDYVKASQSVRSAPQSTEPLAALREVLAPHGLELRGAAGTWYVVPMPDDQQVMRTATLLVTIRDVADRVRVPGATLSIEGGQGRIQKMQEGAFRVSDLAPGVYVVNAGAPAHIANARRISVRAGQVAPLSIVVTPASVAARFENIVVSTSRYAMLRNPQPPSASFDAEAMEVTPNLAGDPLRMVQRLPGTASGGLSAKVHLRGGADDETLLVLDGLELVDPFHLRDYQSVFSAIDQRLLANVDVYTGGFPAAYGDALSGVIAMRTLEPLETAHEINLSFFNTGFLSSGTFAGADGEWLISARRGNLDLVINSIDSSLGDPRYHDAFGRLAYRINDVMNLSLNAFVASDDVLVVTEAIPAELEEAESKTRNAQAWVAVENEWTPNLHSKTLLSHTRLDNNRRGVSRDFEMVVGDIDDDRELTVFAVKQDWTWRSGKRNQTRFGLHWQQLDAQYDYRAEAEFFDFPALIAGEPPPLSRRAQFRHDGEDFGVYASNRFIPTAKWLMEFGLRWDKQTYTGDSAQWSPRLNLLYRLNEQTDLRVSVGRFYQSQRIHELQVEDGVTHFFNAQRADQIIAGVEHRFEGGTTLRIEGYRKRLSSLRPRFENLFDPLALLPELQPDRVRIAPEQALVQGLEIFVARQSESPLSWWGTYTLSKAEDEIDGRSLPRSWDQRHAVSAGLTWRAPAWEASIAAAWRSGWPTTAIGLGFDGDTPVPEIGERNAARLSRFQTVDVHVARHFDFPKSRLTVSFDVINLLDRKNPCCVEYGLKEGPDGTEILEREVENWLPLMPSVGLRWQF